MYNVKITQKRAEALYQIHHHEWWKVKFSMRKTLVKLGLVIFNINSHPHYYLTEVGRNALEAWERSNVR